jgi:hypothetical protein
MNRVYQTCLNPFQILVAPLVFQVEMVRPHSQSERRRYYREKQAAAALQGPQGPSPDVPPMSSQESGPLGAAQLQSQQAQQAVVMPIQQPGDPQIKSDSLFHY